MLQRRMLQTPKTYQVLGPLSEEAYQALKEDIAENGVIVAVVTDEDGTIIDGYHRVQAYDELFAEGRITGGYPVDVRRGLTEDQKWDLAWRLNMQRRHLTSEQKREAIARKLKASPAWADNRVAQLLGVDGKTVRSVRTSLEIRKEIPTVELLEGKDGKYYPRSRTGDLEAELALTKTDAVRQDIMDVGNHLFLERASEEERHERAQKIASKWGVSTEHVEDEINSIVERGPRLKDLGEEKSEEVLAEAFTYAFGTGRQIRAEHVRKKMRALADIVTGSEGKGSEADPEAVAEAVVGYYLTFGRFDEHKHSWMRTDVRRFKLLSEWIERFVPLLEEKLVKRVAVEREVSELREQLQEDEGIDPPP
jgi:hypothetical protein